MIRELYFLLFKITLYSSPFMDLLQKFPTQLSSQVTFPPISTTLVNSFRHVTQSVRSPNNPPRLIRTLGLHVSML